MAEHRCNASVDFSVLGCLETGGAWEGKIIIVLVVFKELIGWWRLHSYSKQTCNLELYISVLLSEELKLSSHRIPNCVHKENM